MLIDSQTKKAIRASIIAMLIFIVVIRPLLTMVWKVILLLGHYSYRGFVDYIYRYAALGHRNEVAMIILMVLIVMALASMVGVLSVMTRRVFKPDAKPKPLTKRKVVMVWLRLVLFACGFVLLLVIPFTDLQLNTSFQQRLTVLAPKLSEQEIKELKAAWASMRSRSDYELIVERMEATAKEHSVVLPKLLLK